MQIAWQHLKWEREPGVLGAVVTLKNFNGGRWWGTVKYVDLDENEKCQFSKLT